MLLKFMQRGKFFIKFRKQGIYLKNKKHLDHKDEHTHTLTGCPGKPLSPCRESKYVSKESNIYNVSHEDHDQDDHKQSCTFTSIPSSPGAP